MSQIDPRRLAALQMQIDALLHEVGPSVPAEVVARLDEARQQLARAHELMHAGNCYYEVPTGYKPPSGIVGRPSRESVKSADVG